MAEVRTLPDGNNVEMREYSCGTSRLVLCTGRIDSSTNTDADEHSFSKRPFAFETCLH
jgi:hypothetical protein